MSLEVVDVDGVALIQDCGRPGRASSGLSESGAYDRETMRQANALVGNRPGAAGIEALTGRLELRAAAPALIAVTGAAGPIAIDEQPAAGGRCLYLIAGSRFVLSAPVSGLRYFIAVRGGIDVPSVLGSRSTDTMAGIGPQPLAAGQCVSIGADGGSPASVDIATGTVATTLEVVPGPRSDWFTDAAVATLFTAAWRISGRADRIGVRLDGPALHRATTAELPSEPCIRGSMQVDHSGQPIILGPDHPVTGGYPVIGVVTNPEAIAQLAPGTSIWLSRALAP